MIVGFLGKGGSGKSTLATGFAEYLYGTGKTVLAVDADHNMDFSYNLGATEDISYVGQGLPDLLEYAKAKNYRDVFDKTPSLRFSLDPKDPFTEKYAKEIKGNLHLMATGPHTESILYDKSCSHTLATPLKVYLPLLTLTESQYVVVDEKAGSDGAGTGVTTGFTLAVVVSEPTVHGMKAARQIAEILRFYETPHIFALNKVRGVDDVALFTKEMGMEPDLVFAFSPARSSSLSSEMCESLRARLHVIEDSRVERTLEKYRKNKEFGRV